MSGNRGGGLQLADSTTGEMLYDASSPACGGARIVRLADHLRHRVMPIEAGPPRTVLAGWFCRQPLTDSLSPTVSERRQS